MRFRRSTFCELVGIDVHHFTSLRRRDQLPFVDETQFGPHGDELLALADAGAVGTRWASYSTEDAVRLRTMLDLMGEDGIDPAAACKIVSGAWGLISEGLQLDHGVSGPDLWLGYERWTDGETVGGTHYGGTLWKIAQESEDRARRDRDEGTERFRLVLVNVSRAARHVLSRAGGSRRQGEA